jgi:hypothetical protein
MPSITKPYFCSECLMNFDTRHGLMVHFVDVHKRLSDNVYLKEQPKKKRRIVG